MHVLSFVDHEQPYVQVANSAQWPVTGTRTSFQVAPPPEWSDDVNTPPPPMPFREHRRIMVPNVASLTPLAVFLMILDDWFFDNLVRQTNLYAAKNLLPQQGTSTNSHRRRWEPVTVEEIKKFLGLWIAMGLIKLPAYHLYWSTDNLYYLSFFRSVMSRDRFFDILRNLHVAEDPAQNIPKDEQDSLWKIRPVIDKLLSKFKSLFYPGKQLSLDEATCGFKGRVNFLVYQPKKPQKWGIRIYQLCDAVTGYTCNFRIYSGQKSRTYDVVFDLMRGYLNKGHEIYLDRYYTSVQLFKDLFAQQTVAVGTCLKNRRLLPKRFLNQKLRPGQTISCRQDCILALKWCDKREVLVLSTKHTPSMDSVSVRAPGGRGDKEKPTAVSEYNRYMMGVDNSDQMMHYYNFSRKTVKWWKKLLIHMVNLSIVNALKLYNFARVREGYQMMNKRIFTEQIVKGIVGDIRNQRDVISFPEQRFLDPINQHLPQRISNDQKKTLTCALCSEKKRRSDSTTQPGSSTEKRPRRSSYRCKRCQITLCVDCFLPYHTKENCWD